ncbi:hypothetical protein SAMN04487948_10678 [Halogranum amylolyticum]|uniref:DUF7344 domain-containing protein n=1 Tax=Halogranum amylolyticum TaxID=660520 RepID=A0A1H8T8T0_9EURY|nr:hypothetical protein [Halogranum amylolyticum]SEO87146.1 hypothetical protein SAMN04487948_10678 [Halogranum amylolyticum]
MSTPSSPVAENLETSMDRSLERDELFHLLQNGRRRGVLRYIHDNADESVFEMRDIAEQVAAWENGKSVAQLTSDERQRVYIALYQGHLPKLDEAGIVEYDQSRGRVEPTPLAGRVERYLTVESATDDSTPERRDDLSTPVWYYGGATLVSTALLATVALGVAPALVAGSLATIVTGLFVAITLGVKYRLLS